LLFPRLERGVEVSMEGVCGDGRNMLKEITFKQNVIVIESAQKKFELEVSKVSQEEMKEIRSMIKRMNFDSNIVVHNA